MIKNMISCFAHDKNHWINLLEEELPSCSLEAVSAELLELVVKDFMKRVTYQLLKSTTSRTLSKSEVTKVDTL